MTIINFHTNQESNFHRKRHANGSHQNTNNCFEKCNDQKSQNKNFVVKCQDETQWSSSYQNKTNLTIWPLISRRILRLTEALYFPESERLSYREVRGRIITHEGSAIQSNEHVVQNFLFPHFFTPTSLFFTNTAWGFVHTEKKFFAYGFFMCLSPLFFFPLLLPQSTKTISKV